MGCRQSTVYGTVSKRQRSTRCRHHRTFTNGNRHQSAAPKAVETLVITPPDFRVLELQIQGTTPLLINRFSAKAIEQMRAAQEAGGTAKSKKVREPKDFDRLYEDAKHVSEEGWEGFHAASIRNGAISACRAAGVVMTRAKLCIFCLHDGFDRVDGTPLVRINGTSEQHVAPNPQPNRRHRPSTIYREWSATLRIRYDASHQGVANLIMRLGCQVGIGEGRPDSKASAGLLRFIPDSVSYSQ
jgi:hypothetical protein